MNRTWLSPAALAAIFVLPGCLGEPEIDERWTLLEIVEATPTDENAYTVGSATSVTLSVRATYRDQLTGALVADLRAGNGITTDDTELDGEDPLAVARDVDFVLQNSVSIGQAIRPITGWDHLIQEFALEFDGGQATPTAADTSVASAAAQPVASSGLFLVFYFSDDVQEVELASGEEIEIVTPVFSDQMEILSTGIEILPQPAP